MVRADDRLTGIGGVRNDGESLSGCLRLRGVNVGVTLIELDMDEEYGGVFCVWNGVTGYGIGDDDEIAFDDDEHDDDESPLTRTCDDRRELSLEEKHKSLISTRSFLSSRQRSMILLATDRTREYLRGIGGCDWWFCCLQRCQKNRCCRGMKYLTIALLLARDASWMCR